MSLDSDSEGDLGVVMIDLQTGEVASHNGDLPVPPASLYKLYVAASTLDLVDLGILTMDTTVGSGACGSVQTSLDYTATDVARLLEELVEGALLSPESTDHLMGLLEEQHFDSALSTALGGKVVFGHKLGTLDHVSHDAGVIDADGDRYVLVAVTAG